MSSSELPDPITSKRTKRSFAEYFFPTWTESLLRKARSMAFRPIETADILAHKWGPPTATNTAYTHWLEKKSMLYNARKQALRHTGKGAMWQMPYGQARPRAAIDKASVWYTAYPISTITKPKQSILSTLGDENLWQIFEQIGIQGLHTGPMKQGGGITGWSFTPSIDGLYDRISNDIEPLFGTKEEYQQMCTVAAKHQGLVIDDLIPGHTGKGSDFLLAQMDYKYYPGIYHMVEIDQKDWHWLPDVPKGHSSVNISPEIEDKLKQSGYIIGKFERVIFYEPGVKETNWSVTKEIRGVDGEKHRWVYLHYFKDGQPAINWLDPTFAGIQLVMGDALHSLTELGAGGLRLDANGFLGAEVGSADKPAWSEGHPLSAAANQLVASMVRKVGGFTFQELNLPLDDIKANAAFGADLSYDFINRPAYHHALATQNTEFLRLMLRQTLEIGIDPASLVHALQNHDELTYELVHFWTLHKDDEFYFQGSILKGSQLRQVIRKQLADKLIGKHTYNKPFTENGIACTTVSVITAILGIESLENLTDEQAEQIKKVHLLLAMYNALQPGVFALSGWDMVGAFVVDSEQVKDLISTGDTRWLNRGAYDMMNINPEATESTAGIPRAPHLYPSLPEQLNDPQSFASQLQQILKVRSDAKLATSHQIAIPEVAHKGILVMLHELDSGSIQATVLNFTPDTVTEEIHSPHFKAGAKVVDMFSGDHLFNVTNHHHFNVTLQPYQGMSLLID